MLDNWLTGLFQRLGGEPVFRIFGKARPEKNWRTLSVFGSKWRNDEGGLRFIKNTLITYTSEVIYMGTDFALGVLQEQAIKPATRDEPVEVHCGRYRMKDVRAKAGFDPECSYSELVAHEIGHSWQSRRLGDAYLGVAAFFTLWREGNHWLNEFENKASENGLFGGIVPGSVHPSLLEAWKESDAYPSDWSRIDRGIGK